MNTLLVDKILLLCLSGCLHIASQEKVDWCALRCSDGSENTLCKYGPKTNAGDCKNIKMATTPVMRKELLDLHNAYRDLIAAGKITSRAESWPIAGNMRQMSWDADLEKLAWRWGQQCSKNPPHDKCRRTPMFKYNGQNKGHETNSGEYPSPNGSFKGWIDEIEKTRPELIDSFNGESGGLFTQVIWANTHKLGCSVIHAVERGLLATTLICNYGPGGNYLDQKVYARGRAACDSCTAGTSCKKDSTYPHLCALPSDDKQPEDIVFDQGYISGSNRLKMPEEGMKIFNFLITALPALLT